MNVGFDLTASVKMGSCYTLCGFGSDLERRLTFFLQHVPWSRYCVNCFRVCLHSMILPYCHVICTSCHVQHAMRSSACVLDARSFRQQYVAVMYYSNQDLAVRHVQRAMRSSSCVLDARSFRQQDVAVMEYSNQDLASLQVHRDMRSSAYVLDAWSVRQQDVAVMDYSNQDVAARHVLEHCHK